jgi:hypothetical protein
MKKSSLFALVITLSFTVTGCFSKSSTVSGSDLVDRTFSTFVVGVPGGWQKIEKEQWANTIPADTAAIFAFKQENGFIRNLNVVKEGLNADATSIEYAKANVLLGSKALFDYRPLGKEELEVAGERTIFHTFLARNSSTEKAHHFSQLYFMKDGKGYTVTCIAEDASSDGVGQCEDVVMSFRLR